MLFRWTLKKRNKNFIKLIIYTITIMRGVKKSKKILQKNTLGIWHQTWRKIVMKSPKSQLSKIPKWAICCQFPSTGAHPLSGERSLGNSGKRGAEERDANNSKGWARKKKQKKIPQKLNTGQIHRPFLPTNMARTGLGTHDYSIGIEPCQI